MFREGVVIYSLFSDVFNDGRIGEEARRRRRRNRYLFKSHLFKNGIVCAGRRAMYILEVMRILLEVRWESMYYYTRRFVESANRVVHEI